MDRDGLSKIKRAKLLASLALLKSYIRDQQALVASMHASGWNAKEAEKRLELLVDSHRLYRSALEHLLAKTAEAGADADA